MIHVDLVAIKTVKEHGKLLQLKIHFSTLSHREPSLLGLQEVRGVDGRGMLLDVLFSWISTYFLVQN